MGLATRRLRDRGGTRHPGDQPVALRPGAGRLPRRHGGGARGRVPRLRHRGAPADRPPGLPHPPAGCPHPGAAARGRRARRRPRRGDQRPARAAPPRLGGHDPGRRPVRPVRGRAHRPARGHPGRGGRARAVPGARTRPPFAVVGVLTGLLAGGFTGIGAFRPRPRTARPGRARGDRGLIGGGRRRACALAGWWVLAGIDPVPPTVLEGADGTLSRPWAGLGAFVVVGGAAGGPGAAAAAARRDRRVRGRVGRAHRAGHRGSPAVIGGSVLDGRTGSGSGRAW